MEPVSCSYVFFDLTYLLLYLELKVEMKCIVISGASAKSILQENQFYDKVIFTAFYLIQFK